MQTVRINELFGGRAMKEDMRKLFGKEFDYLCSLGARHLIGLFCFALSFVLTVLLADVSLWLTLFSMSVMLFSLVMLYDLPDFKD